MTKFSILILFFTITSCSFRSLNNKDDPHKSTLQKSPVCYLNRSQIKNKVETKNKLDDVFNKKSSDLSIKNIENFSSLSSQAIKLITEVNRYLDFKQITLSKVEKSLLWSLVQTSLYPISSSPNSKFQVIIKKDDNINYFEFLNSMDEFENTNLFPFLYGIEYLLKYYKSKKTLDDLSSILDSSIIQRVKIGDKLSNFLNENSNVILKNQRTFKTYIKKDKLLQSYNRLDNVKYKKLIAIYKRHKTKHQFEKNIIVNQKLFGNFHEKLQPSKKQKKVSYQCNFDMELYDKKIYLIDKKINFTNSFSHHTKNYFFTASTSLSNIKIELIRGTHLFKGFSSTKGNVFCHFKIQPDQKKSYDLLTHSFNSRDPRQISHSMLFNLSLVKNLDEYIQLINSKRKILLYNPTRLIQEVRESNKKFKEIEIISPDIISNYYYLNLGTVWSYTSLPRNKVFYDNLRNQKQSFKFIIDNRVNSYTSSCKFQ